MAQDNCPFVRTKRNDKVRNDPPNARVAACFQLYDDLRVLYGVAHLDDDVAWVKSVNIVRTRLDIAKSAKGKEKK